MDFRIKMNGRNEFYVECYDDKTCRSIRDYREAWIALNGMKVTMRDNFAIHVCKLSQKKEFGGDVLNVLLALTQQCLNSLTRLLRDN